MNRREFLESLAGAGSLAALSGCRGFCELGGGDDLPPNYWCTWATQARLLDANVTSGTIAFPGDQGLPGVRDNLNEEILFGKNGWAKTQYPAVREDLLLVLDDGWDVPYGCGPHKPEGTSVFGSLELDPVRFPSFKGTPAQRLAAVGRRVRDEGWRGVGVWVACQPVGEGKERFPEERVIEDLKRKLALSAEAGVRYWKVDWGTRCYDVAYRRMMSSLRDRYAPDLQIEHCRPAGNALNGIRLGKGFSVSGCGRLTGDEHFETRIRKATEEIVACSDVFRIYDTITPINNATDLERAVTYGLMAEKVGSKAWINVEDNVVIAACLGHTAGVMRSPLWPAPEVADPVYRRERAEEVTSAIAWQRVAPAFTAASGLKTLVSDRVLTDRWTFEPGCTWWTPIFGRTVEQHAPAIVARGMPLPKVSATTGDVPFVLASRNPNGALTVGALPRLLPGKGYHTPLADVRLDAQLSVGQPLGVFGRFASIVIPIDGSVTKIMVSRMSDGETHDITSRCVLEHDLLCIPGTALEQPCADRSIGGVKVFLA